MITNAQEAADVLQKGLSKYSKQYKNPNSMVRRDFNDLTAVRDYLEDGKIQQAWDIVFYLDSIVREEAVSPELWKWFESTGLVAQYHGK